MEKVWIILDGDGYEDTILGVCSSKKKAEVLVKALEHIEPWSSLHMMEKDVDRIVLNTMEDLEAELVSCKSAKSLLEELKES